MAQYYYEKFTVIETPIYEYAYTWGSELNTFEYVKTGYESFSFDKNTGKFTLTGAQITAISSNGGPSPVYTLGGNTGQQLVQNYVQAANLPVMFKMAEVKQNLVRTDYSKGSLVQSNIAAEDGTYPANGRHTDGYWYVKGAAVGPLPPGTVANEAYNTVSTGGRKLIRLQDGTLVAVVFLNNSFIKVHISKDDGVNWTQAMALGIGAAVDVCIVPINAIQVGLLYSYGSSIRYRTLTRNGDNFTAGTERILDTLNSPHRVSLEIDPNTGHLYAAWSGQKSPYVTSHNIIRSISTDNGVTWSAASFVTDFNVSSISCVFASVVVRNNQPIYIYRMTDATSYSIVARFSENGSWVQKVIYSAQNNQNMGDNSAVVDKEGVIHVVWTRSDSYNYLWYSKSLDGGKTWSTPTKFVKPGNHPSITVDKNNVVKIVAYQPSGGLLVYTFKNGNWLDYVPPTETATYPQTLFDNTFKLAFGDMPPTIYMKDGKTIQYKGSFNTNNTPNVTLTSPVNDRTLYENDVINISGDAYDMDKDQSVTVYYQINSEPRKVLATNVSQTQIVLSKQLTFKQGKIYDGEVAITSALSDGVGHTLKVWAEDNEGAKSSEAVRTFYVVANRAPAITIDTFETVSNLINNDEITVTGFVSDPENQSVKARYKINNGAFAEFYSDAPGAFTLKIKLDKLQTGENTIVFQVEDSYGFISSKTVKVDKTFNATPLLHSVARYKNTLPNGGINGMFVWVENMTGLTLDVEASMAITGEQENFVAMEKHDPVPLDSENEENSFSVQTETAKDDVAIKLNLSRADITSVEAITLITGALQTP